jgi:uncharacterized Zn-binding protein involved in type VI secretion
MRPVARVGDKTSHGGTLNPPPPPLAMRVASVWIEGKPAAVVGSIHACVKPPDPLLGPANVVRPPQGGPPRSVTIGGVPIAVVGDETVCKAKIVVGARTVTMGGGLL